MTRCLLCFAMPLLLSGQAPTRTAVLEGVVVDAGTHAPLTGARIRLNGIEKLATGADGRFRFADLPPGTHWLSVSRALMLNSEQRLTLRPDQVLADWQVELVRPLEISGKVEDQDGWPAEGCSIQVLHHVYRKGTRTLEPIGYAQSNDLGEYWVGGLKPGRYYLRAAPFGNLRNWDDRYGITYYPSAAVLADAGTVDLVAGGPPAAANIRMLRRRGVRLTGQVTPPVADAGVSVSLDCGDSPVRPCIHGDAAEGAFVIDDVPPGSYTLEARIRDSLAAAQRVEVGTTDLTGLVLHMEPLTPRDLAAQMTFESETEAKDLHFSLQPSGGGTISEVLKRDGTLVFRNILPGRYRSLSAYQPRVDGKMLYLKAARLGDQDILGREFDVPAGSAGKLELTFGSIATVVLKGQVTDSAGRPCSQALVALVPSSWRAPYRTVTTQADQDGNFLTSAPEGEYRVFATRSAIEDSESLPPDAQTLNLKPGVTQSLKLAAKPD